MQMIEAQVMDDTRRLFYQWLAGLSALGVVLVRRGKP
jgi:hypothetical protein